MSYVTRKENKDITKTMASHATSHKVPGRKLPSCFAYIDDELMTFYKHILLKKIVEFQLKVSLAGYAMNPGHLLIWKRLFQLNIKMTIYHTHICFLEVT